MRSNSQIEISRSEANFDPRTSQPIQAFFWVTSMYCFLRQRSGNISINRRHKSPARRPRYPKTFANTPATPQIACFSALLPSAIKLNLMSSPSCGFEGSTSSPFSAISLRCLRAIALPTAVFRTARTGLRRGGDGVCGGVSVIGIS